VNAIPSTAGALTNSYYNYDGVDAPSCTINPACQQAALDLRQWLAQLKAGTASSGATVLTTVAPNTSTGTLTVSVSWNGMIPNAAGATTNDTYQFDFQPQPYQP
jgi:type IV pilus assembly protein PilV